MDILENNFEIQNLLFEEIQKNISSQYLLVDVVSDILETGRDSAYRRIRGEKQLSIKETYMLCKHFHISFDTLMGNKALHSFDCLYHPINLSVPDEYNRYMHALLKNIQQVKNASKPSIHLSASDIPIFHLITQKELTFFKLYTWTQSVYDYNNTLDNFMKGVDTPDLTRLYDQISSNYELIPSAEIWTENTIMSTLNLIHYYVEIGSFSSRDLPLLLCEQVLLILDKLQKWTERGEKGKHSTPFKFYISEMELENTYILMKRSGINNCVVKLFTINSLNISDKEFCRETENWLTKLSERSAMLCGNMEKERFKYFNTQRQKVRILMDKIHDLF
ncbi:hypothetical protein A9168_12220 [Macellibacteroides sp. HH-ZS]|nr:hypothetical protein [Flavobacterium sp.]OCW93299.1 hypothetical protein A9168_12220 [Macellibacteroides sp. HH-ZS]